MSEWICLDCPAECGNDCHSWVEATRVTRPDGSDAWLVVPATSVRETVDPDADDAFDGWLRG